MKSCLCWLNIFGDLLRLFALGLRSKSSLAAENLFLRKQLRVLSGPQDQASTDRPSDALGADVAQSLV